MTNQSYHGQGFNIKIISDINDLVRKLQSVEEKQWESRPSGGDLIFSQTSNASSLIDENVLNTKTQKLLDDYERMKAESEKVRVENSRLKEHLASQEKAKFNVLSHYDSKESLKKN